MNRHLGLFLITVVTTTAAGALQYADFQHAFSRARAEIRECLDIGLELVARACLRFVRGAIGPLEIQLLAT